MVNGNTYSINTDKEITLSLKNLRQTVEISSIKSTYTVTTSEIDAADTHPGTLLNAITLSAVKKAGATGIDKITFEEVAFGTNGRIKADPAVTINTLACSKIKYASNTLAFMADRNENIIIKGNDAIDKIDVMTGVNT